MPEQTQLIWTRKTPHKTQHNPIADPAGTGTFYHGNHAHMCIRSAYPDMLQIASFLSGHALYCHSCRLQNDDIIR